MHKRLRKTFPSWAQTAIIKYRNWRYRNRSCYKNRVGRERTIALREGWRPATCKCHEQATSVLSANFVGRGQWNCATCGGRVPQSKVHMCMDERAFYEDAFNERPPSRVCAQCQETGDTVCDSKYGVLCHYCYMNAYEEEYYDNLYWTVERGPASDPRDHWASEQGRVVQDDDGGFWEEF